jgi:polar amino acid transport system substrate-binding protein
VQALREGKVDAIYATKATALAQSSKAPGTRVLGGHSGGEETAIAVAKGRKLAFDYARTFVEQAKSDGIVQAAIERAELRGVIVAPRQLTSVSTE